MQKPLNCGVIGLLILITASMLCITAVCDQEAALYIEPSSFEGVEYAPGTTITFCVVVANVTNLKALEFNVSYNPEILNPEAVNLELLENLENIKMLTLPGYVWLNLSYKTPITTETPLRIVNVTLRILRIGETLIDLHNTFLWNTEGGIISHTTADGYFNNFNPYDLNMDGKVDIYDVAIVGLAFGSYPGHPRWNPDADLNRDDKVDIQDMTIIADHFGE